MRNTTSFQSGFVSSPLQVLGVLLILGGVVLTFMPTLVFDPGPAKDGFGIRSGTLATYYANR